MLNTNSDANEGKRQAIKTERDVIRFQNMKKMKTPTGREGMEGKKSDDDEERFGDKKAEVKMDSSRRE